VVDREHALGEESTHRIRPPWDRRHGSRKAARCKRYC
jgi:hypothetical protein